MLNIFLAPLTFSFTKLLQSLNTELLMSVRPSARVADVIAEHPINVFCSSFFRVEGNEIVWRDEQLLNANSPIVVNPSGKSKAKSDEHPLNAELPIEVRLSWPVIEVILEQLRNDSLPMEG